MFPSRPRTRPAIDPPVRCALALALLALLVSGSLAAGSLEVLLEYPVQSLPLEADGPLTTVRLDDADLRARAGPPALSRAAEQIVLLPGATVHAVKDLEPDRS